MSLMACPIEPIPDEWGVLELTKLATKIGSGATPRGGKEAYLDRRVNHVLVRSQNVFDRYFDDDGIAYISDSDAAKLKGVEIQPNDVLLNITGDGITFARATIVPDRVLPAVVNQHVCIIRCDPSLCAPGYVLSYLNHKSVKYYMESFNAGGSRRALTKGNIESFLIPVPPIGEQRAIAEILSSLDEKIELDRKQNRTLEAIAQAMFKRWFVEFEFPDQEGRPYKSNGGAMQPSNLGEIPVGWKVGTIGDLVSHRKDSINPGDEPAGIFRHYSIPNFDDGQNARAELGSTILSNKYSVLENSILVSKLNPRFPRIWPVVSLPDEEAVCSTEFQVLVPEENSYCYVLYLLKSQYVAPEMVMRASGTSGSHQRINPDDLLSIEAVVPTKEMATKFHSAVFDTLEKAHSNLEQDRVLAGVRDTLLPKLMSGELRVA